MKSIFNTTYMRKKFNEFSHYNEFVWLHIIEDRCAQMASALTLTTLLSLVPLLTVIFAILGILPAFREQAQAAVNVVLLHFLPTSAEVIETYLKQFTSQAAELTGIGGIVLFITSLILIANIEQALNTIWRVSVARKGLAALILYWAILTLTPLLMVASIAITSYLSVLHAFLPTELTSGNFFKVLPFICTIIAFTLLYITVPNCKVPFVHALIGGIAAAVLFEAGRLGFRLYITHFPNYQLLYGALATLPILSLWIYLSWLFILFGAEITHALRYYNRKSIEKVPHFLIVYRWLAFLWDAQHVGKGLTLTELLRKQPLASMHEAEQIMDHLQHHNWVRHTIENDYVLARDMHEVSIIDLYRSLNYPLPSTQELHDQFANKASYPGDVLLLKLVAEMDKIMNKTGIPTLAECYQHPNKNLK